MKVRWKKIQEHQNYEVSSMGQVRNIRTGKQLNPYDDQSGYLRVKIDGRCCRVHILVAEAFISNPESKAFVNHKKGKKHDNRASQLEWVTPSENTQHAYDLGLINRGGGEKMTGNNEAYYELLSFRGHLQKAKDLLGVQSNDGNWNANEYLCGMYNGMELIVALFENRQPNYRRHRKDKNDGARKEL